MKRGYPYRFPANRRAGKASLGAQVDKVYEETCEALAAVSLKEGDDRVIEELWDVIHAAEGALRKFPIIKVVKGLARVKVKNRQRGDYE